MKRIHHSTLKFHTFYNLILCAIFLVVIIFVRDITLGATMVLLTLYVVGNGIIHAKKNELKRDTLIEYILLSIVVLVILFGTIIK